MTEKRISRAAFEKAWLSGMALSEMAIHFGVSKSTIGRWRRLFEMPDREGGDMIVPMGFTFNLQKQEAYDAAHFLRRFFRPVYHLGREKPSLRGIWLVGNKRVDTLEMMKLAKKKGYVSDAQIVQVDA